MLPPWVIEKVEKARRERAERPRVELPVPPPGWEPGVPGWRRPEPAVERGVVRVEV